MGHQRFKWRSDDCDFGCVEQGWKYFQRQVQHWFARIKAEVNRLAAFARRQLVLIQVRALVDFASDADQPRFVFVSAARKSGVPIVIGKVLVARI